MACTGAYLSKVSQYHSPIHVERQASEDVGHTLYDFQLYSLESAELHLNLSVGPPNVRVNKDFLGP